MYIKLNNGVIEKYPYSIGELRRGNSQISFPANPTEALLAEFGMFPVTQTDQPVVDYKQIVKEENPEQIDGKWTQKWSTIYRTAEEIASIKDSQWTEVRADRNRRLADCDWTQIPDAPVDGAPWMLYRQALRDITTQSNPFNIQWPIAPYLGE